MVDSRGNIYGHLVAGDLGNSIGYIIPATQTFDSMKKHIGNDLSTLRPPLNALDIPGFPKIKPTKEQIRDALSAIPSRRESAASPHSKK